MNLPTNRPTRIANNQQPSLRKMKEPRGHLQRKHLESVIIKCPVEVTVILAVVKQLKQLQIKPRNKSEASTGRESPEEICRGFNGIPLKPDFFLGFLCNCLSCFTTAKITFTSILYPQFIYDLYHTCIITLNGQWRASCYSNAVQHSGRMKSLRGNTTVI